MSDIFKKAFRAFALGAALIGVSLVANPSPALADNPAFSVAAPEQNEWQTINLEQGVVNKEGVVFLPLRKTLDGLQTKLDFEPNGMKGVIRMTCGGSVYALYTYVDNNMRYIGISDNGPWYLAQTMEGHMYVPMAFMQTLTNRQISVVGDKQLSFGDQEPRWEKVGEVYVNQNPFWKGVLQAFNAPAPAPAAEPQATPTAPQPVAVPETAPQGQAVTAPAALNGTAVIASAQKELGVPYVWGGSTPNGFDCSGLTSYVFAQFGIKLPRTAEGQRAVAKPVSMDQLQPGDLVFWGQPAYHVGIYVGNGQYIHAPQPGQSVSFGSTKWYPFSSAGRI